MENHDENCDVLQLAPDLGPSRKPCNCGREQPAPVVHSVSHGWSMMGYYYVSVTTGAERDHFPQTIICKDKRQAKCIAAAIKEFQP
jgi:hypothetical protein